MPLLSKINAPLPSVLGSVLLSVLLSVGLTACGKDDDEKASPAAFGSESGLLQYVADDSPYVFAMLQPAPDDVQDKMEPQVDVTLKAYRQLIRTALREGIESGEADDDAALARKENAAAVVDEMADLFSLDGIRSAGIGRDSTASAACDADRSGGLRGGHGTHRGKIGHADGGRRDRRPVVPLRR
jgi:hypothetical protein